MNITTAIKPMILDVEQLTEDTRCRTTTKKSHQCQPTIEISNIQHLNTKFKKCLVTNGR
jgi:hypothetical protein